MATNASFQYGDYVGTIEFDTDNKRLFGKVIGISDKIIYEGNTVPELELDFHESVDEYIEFCNEMGKKPEKSFSGKILFRTAPDIHSKIALQAEKNGKSVNSWLNDLVIKEIGGNTQSGYASR